MAVEPRISQLDETGQSLLEFLLFLPLMLGITMVLVRVNQAIQVSIVNQKYSRSMAHWLAFNNSVYPERRYRDAYFTTAGYNQLIVGISDNYPDGEGAYVPEASTQMIARSKGLTGGKGPDKAEPTTRGYVRLRTTVAMCTQNNVVKNIGGQFVALNNAAMGEQTTFQFCRSPQNEQ